MANARFDPKVVSAVHCLVFLFFILFVHLAIDETLGPWERALHLSLSLAVSLSRMRAYCLLISLILDQLKLKYANDPFFCVQFAHHASEVHRARVYVWYFSREFDAINQCPVRTRSWHRVHERFMFILSKRTTTTTTATTVWIFFSFSLSLIILCLN